MPERIQGFCTFGKYRNIEVEDDVTAYLEYKNGATGTFITTTGETPGSNRLEISGDNGKLVYEHGKITLYKNEMPESEFNRTLKGGFGEPKCEKIGIEVEEGKENHKKMTQNTVNNILKKEPLIAEAYEGIKSLSISNAAYLSTWLDSWVDLPIDKDLYFDELKKRIATSKTKYNIVEQTMDLKGTSNI
jgi:predicted dehydrogenase